MKSVARVALKPGMKLAEDVVSYKGDIILKAESEIDGLAIQKLSRYSIMCVNIHDAIDYATTHFEKVRATDAFHTFEATYQYNLNLYKKLMTNFISGHTTIEVYYLMQIYENIHAYAKNGDTLLDYLYNMLPSEDDMTHAHCLNSALIAGVFGKWLNLNDNDMFLLIESAFFYDIGKLLLPNSLIWKPEKLTDVEYEKIKTHTILGYRLLERLKLDDNIQKATLMHHERYDGSGYPSRLIGNQINYFAGFIAIIDSYEAMTSARTYRQSLTPMQVISNFEKSIDKYDPKILLPILSKIAASQIGMSVRLNDGTEGEIVLINQAALSRPMLKTTTGIVDLSQERSKFIAAVL